MPKHAFIFEKNNNNVFNIFVCDTYYYYYYYYYYCHVKVSKAL